MTIFELTSVLNVILSILAIIGYAIRIKVTWKRGVLCPGKILLIFYGAGALYICFIFLTLVFDWRSQLAANAEEWSILYVRPFFTYLTTLFIISTWTHPDLKHHTDTIKGKLWQLIHRLTGRR